MIDPEGRSETLDFGPGDVWYFPRGHGHSIQGIGNEECHFILVFDNGAFSEFATFSITDWISRTPKEVLAKQFKVPADRFGQWQLSRNLLIDLDEFQHAGIAANQLWYQSNGVGFA